MAVTVQATQTAKITGSKITVRDLRDLVASVAVAPDDAVVKVEANRGSQRDPGSYYTVTVEWDPRKSKSTLAHRGTNQADQGRY